MLAISKASFWAHPIRTTDDESIWIAPRQDGSGVYAALFNLSDATRRVSLSQDEVGIPLASARDLWSGEPIAASDTLSAVLSPHDAAVYLIAQ